MRLKWNGNCFDHPRQASGTVRPLLNRLIIVQSSKALVTSSYSAAPVGIGRLAQQPKLLVKSGNKASAKSTFCPKLPLNWIQLDIEGFGLPCLEKHGHFRYINLDNLVRLARTSQS